MLESSGLERAVERCRAMRKYEVSREIERSEMRTREREDASHKMQEAV